MKRQFIIGLIITALVMMLFVTANAAIVAEVKKEGMVEYIGAQKDIFVSGKATSVISLEDLAGHKGLYAIGPVDGLDGEITIFDSKPYITKVRDSGYVLDNTFKHGAFFLVWTERTKWKDVPVPDTVKGYVDLQKFVKAWAQAWFSASPCRVAIKWHPLLRANGLNCRLFLCTHLVLSKF